MRITSAGTIQAVRNKAGRVTSYRVRLCTGFNPAEKKYTFTRWRGRFRTKAEARHGLEELRRELEGGLRVNDDMDFATFADLWHSERAVRGIIADTTAQKEGYSIRRLKGYLGDMRLRDITADDITRMLVDAAGQGAGAHTLHDLHGKLKQIFKEAVNRDHIVRSPADKVARPKIPASMRDSLTERELARFTSCLIGFYHVGEGHNVRKNRQLGSRPMDGYGMTVWVALGTGMRKSEILGLQWSCVNLDDAHIDVRQTLSKKGEVQQRAKSKKSIRRIPIDPETVRRLRAWRAVQAEYFVATIGRMPSSDSPVCSNEVCGFLRQDNFGRWFQGFCVATGFGRWVDDDGDEIPARHLNAQGHPVDESGRPYSRMNPKPRVNRHYKGLTLHGLRHTYATMLVGNGVDFRTASELLGHTSASITLNLYAHALPAQKRAASDLIGSLLSAEQQSNVIAI